MTITSSCDLKTLSELLNLSARRLQQLAHEGVVTKLSRGQYDLARSVQGYVSYLNAQIPNKVNSEETTDVRALTNASRAKLVTEKAIMAKMDRREMEKSLLEASEVKRDAATSAVNVRQAMMSLPDSLSPLLVQMSDAREIRSLLRREVTQSLTDVSAVIAAYAASREVSEAEVVDELLLPEAFEQ